LGNEIITVLQVHPHTKTISNLQQTINQYFFALFHRLLKSLQCVAQLFHGVLHVMKYVMCISWGKLNMQKHDKHAS